MNFTFDPLDPILLVFHSLWLVIGAGLLVAGYKARGGWMRASLAGLGLSILGMFTLAILPSWWLYFADGSLKWGGQGCVEFKIADIFRDSSSDSMQCLKQSLKDTVVVIENAVVVAIFTIAFVKYQKKFPTQLAPGESKPEATGGYK